MTVCAIAALLLAGCGGGGSSSKAGTSSATTRSGAAAGSGGSAAKSGGVKSSGVKLDAAKPTQYAKVPSSAATGSGLVEIAYRDIAIDPDAVRVKLGSTIRWTNYDSVPANVTSEGGPLKFSSGNFGEGKTYELKATKVGVIHYECTLEPTTMNGTIEVVE